MNLLYLKAFAGLLFLFAAMAALLFVPAGTIDYRQAWTFLAVYFACSLVLSLYLMIADPALMRRRMRGGPTAEKEPVQKIIMTITSLGFAGLLVVPALDHRFAWSQMPPMMALAGDVLVGIGWLAILFVFRATALAQRPSKLPPIRKSSPPASMRWCGTRCMRAPSSCFSASRSHSVRGGGYSSWRQSCPR